MLLRAQVRGRIYTFEATRNRRRADCGAAGLFPADLRDALLAPRWSTMYHTSRSTTGVGRGGRGRLVQQSAGDLGTRELSPAATAPQLLPRSSQFFKCALQI